MKAVIATQLGWHVRSVSVVKQHDANVFDHSTSFVDSCAEIISFAGRPKSGARWLRLLETLKPLGRANDEYIFRLERTITTPLSPSFIRTARIVFQKELIEYNNNIALA